MKFYGYGLVMVSGRPLKFEGCKPDKMGVLETTDIAVITQLKKQGFECECEEPESKNEERKPGRPAKK